jgi:hypothetical protein
MWGGWGFILISAPLPNEAGGSSVAIATRCAAACAKAQRDVFIVVHSVDAKRLRSQDCQAALAALNASHSYLVASADHVNAPLLWNATTWRAANFCSEDATTFAPYDREAGRWDPFERTSNAKSQQKLLDTSGLVYVLQSLTPRHVELLRLLATAQQESNEGMLFKTLQSQCRYKMIAHTEDQVHSYLVELTDHGLCRKEVRSGSTYVAVEPGYDFGWHTVGRWNYAMADLPLPVKCIVKYYYRGEVFSASFAAARDAHSRAKELNPRNLNHRVELAKSLAKLGRPGEAREELQGALDLPMEDINDWVTRKQGRRLLAELEAAPQVLEGGRGPQPAA